MKANDEVMTMSGEHKHRSKPAAWTAVSVAVALLACLLSSCEKIFDYEGDCTPHWQVRFIYDYNMKFADAFPGPMGVGSVRLYVFDAETHSLVLEKEAAADSAGFSADYAMPVEELAPGRYDFVAWCGLEGNSSFQGGKTPETYNPEATAWSLSDKVSKGTGDDRRLKPLYYGRTANVEITNEQGTHTVTVSLMKDVNDFTIVLQHLSKPLNPADFDITITDGNASLRWDNALAKGANILYRPWSMEQGTAEDAELVPGYPAVENNVLIVRLSTSRLVEGRTGKPHVTITRKEEDGTSTVVFDFDLLSYLLMVKPHLLDAHNNPVNLGSQEFLDREDYWPMHFILDDKLSEEGGWYVLELRILDWHVIENWGDMEL